MASYGQFCAVSRALDLLGERWTLLIVREVLLGGRRFTDLRKGVPRISRTMLSDRLTKLVDAGVLEKRDDGYWPTQAGEELLPLVTTLGVWGRRWLAPDPEPEDLDPDFLFHDMARRIVPENLPSERVLIRFELTERPPDERVHYLHVEYGRCEVCSVNPGFEVTATVAGSTAELTRWWLGDVEWARAGLDVRGERRRDVPSWFGRYLFASTRYAGAA